MILKWSLRNY